MDGPLSTYLYFLNFTLSNIFCHSIPLIFLLYDLRNNPVYRYFYNHQSSVDAWPTWSGSKHGDELEFTFGVPLRSPKLYSAQEIKFSR